MRKVGYTIIKNTNHGKKKPRCLSCGMIATVRMVFRDDYCRLKVALCPMCAKLEYEELKLQKQIDFPIVA